MKQTFLLAALGAMKSRFLAVKDSGGFRCMGGMQMANSLKLALLSGAMVETSSAVELPRMFSDHGVLQQGEVVPVWGWGSPGETVSVEFGGQKVAQKAGQNGEWKIDLKDLKTNVTGRKMTVTGDSSGTVEVADLLVGLIAANPNASPPT